MHGNMIIGLAGPTASGKSETAVCLAKDINGEVVSADVMQSYKELKVGTAKISKSEMRGVTHYMIDEYSVDNDIDISVYSQKAIEYVGAISAKDKTPIITGGSGLYLDSILYTAYNYETKTVAENIRSELEQTWREKGSIYLFEMLQKCDPEYAALTHPNNVKRVIRALEYFQVSGKKKSENIKTKNFRFKNTFYFAIKTDRTKLYERINKRVDLMVENGLIEEVRSLINENVSLNSNAMKAIGYKEIAHALINETDITDAVELVKQKSRNYAKRQMTWFNANKDIIWVEGNSAAEIAQKIIEVINGIR